MISGGTLLLVEGEADKRFMECLIQYMGLEQVEVVQIGGKAESLHKVKNVIQQQSDGGQKIVIAIDADADVPGQRQALIREQKKLDLQFHGQFLLPNDEDQGCLEDLLIEIAVAKHKQIHGCFDKYTECVQALPGDYKRPDLKGKVYAYCEALGIERKSTEINYLRSDCWNLEAPALKSLKAFLTQVAS